MAHVWRNAIANLHTGYEHDLSREE